MKIDMHCHVLGNGKDIRNVDNDIFYNIHDNPMGKFDAMKYLVKYVVTKTDDENIQWGVTKNLPEGVWKKIVIDIESGVESETLDSNSINEILFHFEGKGTMMIDGLENNSNDPPIIQAVQNSEIKLVQSLPEQKTNIDTAEF